MCGRYTHSATATELIENLKLLACPDFSPRYNIASQCQIQIIRFKPDTGRVGQLVCRGLIPSLAIDPKHLQADLPDYCAAVDQPPQSNSWSGQLVCLSLTVVP